MRRPTPILAAALAAAVLLAACSGGETATAPAAATPTIPGGADFDVVMESFAFTPAESTVPAGTTVTWINRHGARHDVVADDGTFASPLFGPGETFSFTFTAAGEYHYVCSIHPRMAGTITVTP
ncbi:MAG: plastocyanin/azurin family copper-binding protein [Actinomycetota bacterium]